MAVSITDAVISYTCNTLVLFVSMADRATRSTSASNVADGARMSTSFAHMKIMYGITNDFHVLSLRS